jgi:membrane glycosyltransferase
MLFAVAPLWALVLVFALANAATGGGGADPALLALTMLAVWAALQAPKWLGFAELLLKPALAAEYGGRARVLRGAALALPFTLLLDSISACNTALVLALLPFRQGPGWAVQNRADRGVGWWDAARLFWPHTLFGVLALALLPLPAWPWALPWLAGLLLAVPFCVLTSSPRVSAALRACGLAATPEELAANPPAAPPP